MGQPEFPTLEESTEAIADKLGGLLRQLVYPEGVSVQHFPEALVPALEAIEPTLDELRGSLHTDLDGLLAPIGTGLESLDATLTASLGAEFGADVGKMSLALEGIDVDLSGIGTDLQELDTNLGTNLNAVATGLCEINKGIQDMSDALARVADSQEDCCHKGTEDQPLELNIDWAGMLEQLVKAVKQVAPDLLPPTPIAGVEESGSIFGQQTQATVNAVEKLLDTGEGHNPSILSWVTKTLSAGVTGQRDVAGTFMDAIASAAPAPGGGAGGNGGGAVATLQDLSTRVLNWFTEEGVASPDKVWRRCLAAYGAAIGIGLTAQTIAAVGSVDVLGCCDLNLGYITGFIGKMAGFDSLANAIHGTFYDKYIREPLRYHVNALARSYIPGVGDLLRFKYKRIFGRKVGDPSTSEPPYTFAECLAYWGYSDEWIAIYEDDLYREPMARDLLLMAEVGQFPDEWWEYKVRRLGYSDADAPLMVEAFKRRASRTQLLDLYRRLWYLASEGYISLDDFRERAAETKLPEMAIDFGAQAAEAELERGERRDLLDWAKGQYAKDVIDDDGLRDLLEQVFDDPEHAKRVWNIEQLKRYRSVYFMRPDEEARKALPVYREAFLEGAATESEYRALLTESGLEGRVRDLRLSLDLAKRDARLLARFRRFKLPALRDEVLHGLVSVADYARQLREAGFPAEYLSAERNYARAQLDRRVARTLRAEQLPAYRQAYVVGLIARGTLSRAMRDAGLTAAGIEAELTVLDYRRAETERRRREADARKRERELADEKRQADRERREAERERELARRDRDRREAERRQQAAVVARAAASAAKAAALARRPGWPADVQRIRKQIAAAYKDADELLPDDVWQLGLRLDDELARVPGPDPELVDALIGRIEQSLARYAGVLPA